MKSLTEVYDKTVRNATFKGYSKDKVKVPKSSNVSKPKPLNNETTKKDN